MPTYKITGPDGKVYRVTGDGTAEEALAQVQARVSAAPAEDDSAPAESGSTQEQRAAVRQAAQKAALDRELAGDYSGFKGLVANVGAGADNVVQGAKQLFGFGDDDATIQQRRALKKTLGDSTPGGGVAQFAGELAASTPLAIGGGAGLTALAGKALPKAVPFLSSLGGRTFNTGLAGRAAAEGGVQGALAETTEDESRALNTTGGALMGAALPLAMAGGSAMRRLVSGSQAPIRAGRTFEKQLGKEGIEEIQDVLDSPIPNKLPLSTAGKSQSVKLAALERGARGRSDWAYEHDKPLLEKAASELQSATKDADELVPRIADRETVMEATKKYLGKIKGQRAMGKASKELSAVVQDMRATPAVRQNPELTKLLGQTEEMLHHPERTAGDFASQYWRLSSILDDAKLPVENRDVILKLRDAVGASADTASKGEFSAMLGRYQAEQNLVGQAEAAKAIREDFVSPLGVPTRNVTAGNLNKSLASKGENAYGTTLTPEARSDLTSLQKELEQHELYKAGNSPGQSQLALDDPLSVVSSGRDNPFNYFPLVKGSANWLFRGSREATTKAADKAMRSPQEWQKLMDAYAKSKTPITPQEYAERIRRQLIMAPARAGITTFGGEQ